MSQHIAEICAVVLAGLLVITGVACRMVSRQAKGLALPPATFDVYSSVDGTQQPCIFVPAKSTEARPLLVGLHPWSHGFNTFAGMANWQEAAAKRDWHYVQPHFRGPNRNADACGSAAARQDILDAVDYVIRHYKVDASRIYLAGCSGGGHMALVMAAEVPERWAAVSAWCPITDLKAWHAECQAKERHYWRDIEAACGGPPGASSEVDGQYAYRSPVLHLAKAVSLPIDINAGIHDGHSGSVPIHHTLDAFNVIARAKGNSPVSAAEIATLSEERPLDVPADQDESYGRQIHLRRCAGETRVTIFEGGHEGDAFVEAACLWLEKHRRTSRPGEKTK